MTNRIDFLRKYNIDPSKFEGTGLKWEDLDQIRESYKDIQVDLQDAGNVVFYILRRLKEVHSLKMRIKNPDHLIVKIIRKKIIAPSMDINLDNYVYNITDLIGIRALHLFKEDWEPIHNFIIETWEKDLHEKPLAYIRDGDPAEFMEHYKERDLKIEEHPRGYRSIHYLITTSLSAKKKYIVEVQVRTIFEEGWSEIDHRVRYPYNLDNVILSHYLNIFNRLAGSADEMGSFVKILKNALTLRPEIVSEEKPGSIYIYEKEDPTQAITDDTVRTALKESERLCSIGDFPRAENILLELDRKNPANIDVLKAIIFLYIDPKCKLKNNEEILLLMEEKKQYFTSLPEYYRLLAISYMEMRDEMKIKKELGHPTVPIKENALEVSRKAIELSPNDPYLKLMLGYVYYWFSEIEAAIRTTEEALSLAESLENNKEIIRCKNNLAYYYAMTLDKKYEEIAREYSSQVYDYYKESALHIDTCGFVKWKYAKDIDEMKAAAAFFEMAVKKDPFDPDYNRHLSECLQEIKLREFGDEGEPEAKN
jgi:putative GTP pyrophosphokinase